MLNPPSALRWRTWVRRLSKNINVALEGHANRHQPIYALVFHSNYATMQRVAASTQHCIARYLVAQRRSVIVALALAAGCNAFIAPSHPATGKALRAAAIEEEPEAPKYPTVNVIAAASDYAST